jgi:putative membrane protein
MAEQEKQIHVSKKGIFVRDHLAELRTDLANRRTLLSHIRTSLAFLGGGLALIKFSGHPSITVIGWLLLPAGILILVQGVITYVKVNSAVRAEKQRTEAAEQTTL